jgi:hypothetical protein
MTRLVITYEDYKKILTALLAHFGLDATELVNRLHGQDPAADGPEVNILNGKPLC